MGNFYPEFSFGQMMYLSFLKGAELPNYVSLCFSHNRQRFPDFSSFQWLCFKFCSEFRSEIRSEFRSKFCSKFRSKHCSKFCSKFRSIFVLNFVLRQTYRHSDFYKRLASPSLKNIKHGCCMAWFSHFSYITQSRRIIFGSVLIFKRCNFLSYLCAFPTSCSEGDATRIFSHEE